MKNNNKTKKLIRMENDYLIKRTDTEFLSDRLKLFEIDELAKNTKAEEYLYYLTTILEAAVQPKSGEVIGDIYYKNFVECAEEAIYVSDSSMKLIRANAYCCGMLGYTQEELLRLSNRDILFDEDESLYLTKLKEMGSGRMIRGVRRMKKKDGSLVEAESNGIMLKGGGILMVAIDVNKQINAAYELEKKIKEISAYKYALDESVIVAITDRLGIITHANDNFCRISKFSRRELIGRDHRIINSGFHSQAFMRDLWITISNGTIWKGELKNKAKDGTYYWVDTTIIPFLDEQAFPYQYVAMRTDITRRKLAEEEINSLNAGMQTSLVERTEELLANKKLAFQNGEKEGRAAELLIANAELNFQNGEKEERAKELVVANKELDFQNHEKEQRAGELILANRELDFQSKEKETRAEELILANKELVFQNIEKERRSEELAVANSELVYQNNEKEKRANELIVANHNLKISEAQFREINKELESFSYSVSHDLRAPLRAIHGYSKMLKANFESQLDTEANRLMNNIVSNAKKMGQLIDDLLDFSRIGRKELLKVNMAMNSIVTNICSELASDQPHREITFQMGELAPALADHVTLKHVWLNLISNAVKYTAHKKTAVIEIGSEMINNEIVYHIKDNGAGFDMRYADKLFGVFQRLHSDEEFEGTGVGLALVHRIISKHGGRVWGNGQVDQGASFYFTLNKVQL